MDCEESYEPILPVKVGNRRATEVVAATGQGGYCVMPVPAFFMIASTGDVQWGLNRDAGVGQRT